MHIYANNVNDAFRRLVAFFAGEKYAVTDYPVPPPVRKSSRNGPVMMIEEPVTITYERPTARVLFNAARDANPFFHLYEALWMLAGRNDVAPLSYYNSKIQQYSDDGNFFNGAYGYRWRHASPWEHEEETDEGTVETEGDIDQLDLLIDHLRADSTSRRAVLQMWNVEDDLLKIGLHPDRAGNLYHPNLAHPPSKDVCCNLSVLFSIREDPTTLDDDAGSLKLLDMTVLNRSNDMIWGMLGANYVHFTILQEYVAARLGIEIGRYHHVTNNLHVYEANWKPREWLAYYGSDIETEYVPACNVVPLVKDPETFEKELPKLVEANKGACEARTWSEPFLQTVAQPMCQAWHAYKKRDFGAVDFWINQIDADDWGTAAQEWMERRIKKEDLA